MKIGLVLPGGGGKGAYQIGVIKALNQLGINKYIEVVSGTSIGALNALLFVQGDLKIAEEIWENISLEEILPTDNFDLMKKSLLFSLGAKKLSFIKKYMPNKLQHGNLSREGLLKIINSHLDLNKIKSKNISCYATCTELETFKVKYFNYLDYDEETIKKILLATSALPTIYEPEEVGSRKYLDGALVDNIPIQPVYGEGCDIIIVAHLSREMQINRSEFPRAKIIEIFPSYMEEGVLKGTFNFSTESIKQRIYRGEEDTKNILEPILEIASFIDKREKNIQNRYVWFNDIKKLFNNYLEITNKIK